MDREPCRHRWYEPVSGGETTTDVCAGYDNRPVLCLRLEPKSSVKPPVASSCPVPRSVATVHVGWGGWDRHLALMAQIERARGRPSSGSLPVLSVLDPLFYITSALPGSTSWAGVPEADPRFKGSLVTPNLIVAAVFVLMTVTSLLLSFRGETPRRALRTRQRTAEG